MGKFKQDHHRHKGDPEARAEHIARQETDQLLADYGEKHGTYTGFFELYAITYRVIYRRVLQEFILGYN